jgi:hypothetical protein
MIKLTYNDCVKNVRVLALFVKVPLFVDDIFFENPLIPSMLLFLSTTINGGSD